MVVGEFAERLFRRLDLVGMMDELLTVIGSDEDDSAVRIFSLGELMMALLGSRGLSMEVARVDEFVWLTTVAIK
jgi:hypothetical protein